LAAGLVTVSYTCRRCGAIEREILVRLRDATEAIAEWVEMVRFEVAEDHFKLSPYCRSRHVDLKIPLRSDLQSH
jgi:hypothetical protein